MDITTDICTWTRTTSWAMSLLVTLFFQQCAGDTDIKVTRFQESDSVISNPGQGWMTMRQSPEPGMRFPYSVIYRSFNWADAEPAPGKINWALLDEVIDAWKPAGATVSFRVMPTNPHSKGYYASPKWLFDAGCKGFEYVRGGGTFGGAPIKRIEPDYSDPLYLKYHGEFIAALGRRYDGDPRIEFIDIGSYGYWGEWHTSNWAPREVKKQIIDFYLKAFKKTQLVFMTDGADMLQYGLDQGTGMRRDGVGSTWHEQNWIGSDRYAKVPGMAEAWKHHPIIFEWYGRYDYLVSQGWSFASGVNFMLRNHVTLINDNVGTVPEDAFPQLQKLARLAGARFVIREISHPSHANAADTVTLRFKLANKGVGKLYYPYVMQLCLLDSEGDQVSSTVAKADPLAWLPGEHDFAESLAIPAGLKLGEYTIAAKLIDPDGTRRPFSFAMNAPSENGCFALSSILVGNMAEPATAALGGGGKYAELKR